MAVDSKLNGVIISNHGGRRRRLDSNCYCDGVLGRPTTAEIDEPVLWK